MTKMNKLKAALLAASSMLVSGTAFAQVVDTWEAGDVGITSENGEGATVAVGTYEAATVINGVDLSGERLSISQSAVGVSGSLSVNNAASFDGAVNGTVGDVTIAVTNGEGADVSNIGSITKGVISDGVQNGISRSAVGSSASTSVNVLADGGAIHGSTYTVGDVGITSTNNAAVVAGVNFGTSGTATDAPKITDGTNNSISATAIGATGSMSVATTAMNGAAETTAIEVGDVTILAESVEDGSVLMASTTDGETKGGIFGAKIDGGTSNSISANAIGTSASFGYSTTLKGDGSTITSADTIGDVKVTSTNASAVTNLMDIGKSGTTSSVDSASISDTATNSSIGVAGIGATASVSYGSTDLTGGSGATTNAVEIGATTIATTNTGAVLVSGSIYNPSVGAGFGNSISVAAVGASASQTFNNTGR